MMMIDKSKHNNQWIMLITILGLYIAVLFILVGATEIIERNRQAARLRCGPKQYYDFIEYRQTEGVSETGEDLLEVPSKSAIIQWNSKKKLLVCEYSKDLIELSKDHDNDATKILVDILELQRQGKIKIRNFIYEVEPGDLIIIENKRSDIRVGRISNVFLNHRGI